jgi:transcriptional regulator with XRE-family HTH domain
MLNGTITNIRKLSLEGVARVFYQEDIIRLIEAAMQERDFNKAKLARALNKSRGWASQLMKNQINISVQTLLEIAKVLNVSPGSLLPGSNPKPSALSFEEYIRQICKDEMIKILKSDTEKEVGKPGRKEHES